MLIVLSAAEPSSHLIAEVLEHHLSSFAKVHHLSTTERLGPILGFTSTLKHSVKGIRLLAQAKKEISALQPDRVVLIGIPEFHMHIGRWCRNRGIFTVQLGSPQFWAWGRNRLGYLRRSANLVICLFPFEEFPLRVAGIDVRYFGNPLLDIVRTTESREQTLLRLGFRQTDHYLVFMPGSRPAEQTFHIPLFTKVYRELRRTMPPSPHENSEHTPPLHGVMLFEPSTMPIRHSTPKPPASDYGNLLWTSERRYDTMTHADCAVICSGTATLEAAILGLPMVVSYHLPPVDRLLAHLFVRTRHFALPNIIAARRIVPELLQPSARLILAYLKPLLQPWHGASPKANRMKQELTKVKELIGPTGAISSIVRLLIQPTIPSGIECSK